MRHEFQEIVLPYSKRQLDAWSAGDKSLLPHFVERDSMIINQDRYHFGEAFVLDHFHRKDGWLGFRFFALGEWEPGIARYLKGRRTIERMVDRSRLEAFRRARSSDPLEVKGKGEPDVLLYRPSGELLFLEVKKGADRIGPYQLRCLAQIRDILGCGAEVVYLREESQRYTSKVHVCELAC